MSAAACCVASPAMAQAAGEGLAVDEVVVTAQKREQNLQDVGLSVTAIGENGIKAIGRQDVTALAGLAPGLQVNQYSPTITVFNIRGVSQNDFADSQEAPIAFYNDEVYVSALGAISGQTFDLERVEVLRGPQGTLFGRNATGGLVQIISKRPTRTLEGFATVTGGSYDQFATEAAISGPLADWARARVSFTSNRHDGYIENRIGPDLGNSRFYGGRMQLEADVGSAGLLRLKVQGLRNDNETSGGAYTHVAAGFDDDGLGFALPANVDFWGTCPGCDVAGYREPDNDPFTGSFDRRGFFDRKYWTATARYEHDFGDVDLTSITDYQSLRKRYGEDSDMSPLPVFNYDTAQDLFQVSQELRLAGKVDRLTWLAGVYGLRIKTNNAYRVDAAPILGFVDDYGGSQKTDSLAAFGQVEYALTDAFTAIVGYRYSWDWKEYRFTHAENGVVDFVFTPGAYPDLAKQSYKNYSGKVELDYRPAEGVLLYASVNRGTKSGGFGVQAFAPFDPTALPYDQEVLTNTEGGFKLTLADRRVTLNGSIFRYHYKDYQAFIIVGLSQQVTNRPAEVKGFDLDVAARITPELQLSAFVSHLDTKVEDIRLPSGRVVDRKLPQAPSWSLGGMLRYERTWGPGKIALQTDWKYDSSQFFSTFNSQIDHEPKRAVGNVRLSYEHEDGLWEAAVFVNNVTDKAYRIYNLDVATAIGSANQTYARPRWIGASLTYRLQ
ncbi:MAG TPA: TonB-dependent receptor [Phenylobacterium sp.]|nr:TonB-dependent receptor [Phenylobacterium sp.]